MRHLIAFISILIIGIGAFASLLVMTPDYAVGPAEVANYSHDDDAFTPGMGMTYGGKIGMEIAPGLVMSPSGGLSMGFGF